MDELKIALANTKPDVESAFYFAGVTYTTLGYGGLVLPKGWRSFAARLFPDVQGGIDVSLIN
jgi:hypothetical protein